MKSVILLVSDVVVTWEFGALGSAITSQTGCAPATVTADTTGFTFTCTVTSDGSDHFAFFPFNSKGRSSDPASEDEAVPVRPCVSSCRSLTARGKWVTTRTHFCLLALPVSGQPFTHKFAAG